MVPHLYSVLDQALTDIEVPHFPLDEAFAGIPRNQLHFRHDPHWNVAGHHVAANAIEAFLLAHGIFDAIDPVSQATGGEAEAKGRPPIPD